MNSIALRKRADWLAGVARRLDPGQGRHLFRYAARLTEIANDMDAGSPQRLQQFA